MYYVMRCPLITNENGELLVEIENDAGIGEVWSWGSGEAFEAEEIAGIPDPIPMNVRFYRGYKGLPTEFSDTGVSVMSRRLSQALLEAGVDNLDCYPVLLTNPETQHSYDYVAYNIIGKIAAADMEKSDYTTYDGKLFADVGFRRLVLDEAKAQGVLMFRLAEKLSTILVHEHVRKHVLDQGIDTLKFIKPEDYLHL